MYNDLENPPFWIQTLIFTVLFVLHKNVGVKKLVLKLNKNKN